MGRQFALKVMHQRHIKNRFVVERFELEARATASLNHPNVVSISDYWIADDGRHCLLMQLLKGRTLAEEIMKRKRLPTHEVVLYAVQTLQALVTAHAKGLIHRDIKPENLFLNETANSGVELKVLDFGFARVASNQFDSARFRPILATRTGASVGSPRFASPEALRGKDVDFRSDIYSLGVVMYLSLVGVYNPFDIATVPTFTPPSSQGVADCTPEIDAIIMRAVETRPEDRFQSAQEFLDALLPQCPTLNRFTFDIPLGDIMKKQEVPQ
jgi:serine/threonine-protein kinase